MRSLFYFLILFFIGSCTTGPSTSSTSSDTLFVDYYLRYLESEGEMKAEASFAKGKNLKEAKKVDLEGTVSINGMPLEPIRIGSTIMRYQKSVKTHFIQQPTFTLKDDYDNTTTHQVDIEAVDKFIIKDGVLKKSKNATLRWDGDALQNNEQLLVMLTDVKGKAHSVSFSGPTSLSEVEIPLEEIARLDAGMGYVYIVKKINNLQSESNISIHSLIEYYSNRIDVPILN